ncbi:MAG: hypothetical protein LBD23_00110 [Oscillospiraceae bacterium]|jgi:rubrerythrin|nr:hypothetical protein [Oscillospiraceae bacterium]
MYNIDNPNLSYLKRDLSDDHVVYYSVDDENMAITIQLIRSRKTGNVGEMDFRTEEIRKMFTSQISEDAPIDLGTLKKICSDLGLSFGYHYHDDESIHFATKAGEFKILIDSEEVTISEGKYKNKTENEIIAIIEDDTLDMRDFHFDVIFIHFDMTKEKRTEIVEEEPQISITLDSIPGTNIKAGASLTVEEFFEAISDAKEYFRDEDGDNKASIIRQLRQKSDSIIDRNWLRAGAMTNEELDDFEKNNDYLELLVSCIDSDDDREQLWDKYIQLCKPGRRQALNVSEIMKICECPDDVNLYDLPFADVCKAIRAVELNEEESFELQSENLNKTFEFEIPEYGLFCEKCETTNYIYKNNQSPLKCDNCGEDLSVSLIVENK